LLGKKPIHVIQNGLNIEVFKPHNKLLAKKTLNIKDKKTIVFGAVGATSDKNKGFDLLLASLRKLESYYEQDKIQLIIFGGDFKNETHFEVINLGFITDTNYLSMLYSAADVMVVPSKHENLPYTVMESLSCGTPVVAFNVGGNSDMIDHKQNGYLANPYDIKDFTEGIYWCIENAANEKLNIQSRQKVLHNFPIEKIAAQHLDLYKSLL
jgi:glycosyltransferase involved in cell wall biosynthesis